MRLIFEEFVNGVLILNLIINVSCKGDHGFQRLIKEVALESQLDLSDIFTCNTFFVKLEQLLTDDLWIDISELDWKEHLAVTL